MLQPIQMTKSEQNPLFPCLHIFPSSLAENTRRAYEIGWRRWEQHCAGTGACPLPGHPREVVQFLVETATRPGANGRIPTLGTVFLWRCAINRKHVERNLPSPTVHPQVTEACRSLERLRGRRIRQVKALREHHIRAMLECCPPTPIGLRNAAIIALGFAAALRRSEIVALTVDDLEMAGDHARRGMFLHIRKSKTDQQGQGHKIAVLDGVNLRPVTRLKKWLRISGIAYGPIFQGMRRDGSLLGASMHHSNIPILIKQYAKRIGLNPSEIAGHSLRAGFVTSAAVHHARLDKIMEITRHTSPASVLKYIRDVDRFRDHAGKRFL